MAKKKYARCFVGAALAAAVMMPGIAFASDDTQGANVHEQQCELSQEAIERSSRDDAWSFNFTFLGATAQAPSWREKDDYSSTYIGVNHMRCDRFMVYVDGAKDGYGNGRTNCTEYGAAAVRHTGEFKIWNQVREKGFSSALLTGWANYEAGTASGLWGPDCWNESAYPVINCIG